MTTLLRVHMRAPWARVARWAPAVLVEIALYLSYVGHDARFHWFTHFFVGASTALVVMTVAVLILRRPARHALVWVVAGHLVAMFPDLLFTLAHIPHERWMDVFLGHLSSHFVAGRNLTWYVVFLGCLAVYLVTVDRLRRGSGVSTRCPSSP